MADRSSIIACKQLVVGYRRAPVTHPIDLHVEPGERVALCGPNGSGRTTLLRTLSGLTPLVSGSALVLGRSLVDSRPHHLAALGLAFVGEERGVFTSLRVLDHVALATRDHPSRERFLSVMTLLPNLQFRRHSRVATLSGGERQVLGISCALARLPRVLLADQIAQGIQPATRGALLDLICAECERSAMAVIFTDECDDVIDTFATRRLDMAMSTVLKRE